MADIEKIIDYLKSYKGRNISIMEVCGSHTSAIMKNGLRQHLPESIRLVSGPGCPVCVTPAGFIDIAAGFALKENHVLVTFGDMMKVPGSRTDLYDARSMGGRIKVVYSPLSILELAGKNPDTVFIMAAVGFETTAPAYALLLERAINKGLRNIRLLTAIKTIIPAMEAIIEEGTIDGFICPGHVSAIIGASSFEPLAERYKKPMTVAGFESGQVLASVYDLVRQIEAGVSRVHNLYPDVVRNEGNIKARALLDKFFSPCDTWWRGLGLIKGSGLCLKPEYEEYNASNAEIKDEEIQIKGCCCSEVIKGKINPDECPLFGTSCTPAKPRGACMVSSEGACGIWYGQGGVRIEDQHVPRQWRKGNQ